VAVDAPRIRRRSATCRDPSSTHRDGDRRSHGSQERSGRHAFLLRSTWSGNMAEPGNPRRGHVESPALASNPRLLPASPETPRPACHAGGRGFECAVFHSSDIRTHRPTKKRRFGSALPSINCGQSLPFYNPRFLRRRRDTRALAALFRADEGTRTLNLLHGKDTARGDRSRQEPTFGSVVQIPKGCRRDETTAADGGT
jgi:hypothetical protein